jgi:predicted nucleotidyltransferase
VGQRLNCYPEGVTTTVVPRDRILSVLQAGPPLRLAMLFGSAARGTAHPGSDLDIGIVPVDPDLALSIELDLQAELMVAVQDALDVALHVASDEGWGIPASYAESFALLERHALVDAQLSRATGRGGRRSENSGPRQAPAPSVRHADPTS